MVQASFQILYEVGAVTGWENACLACVRFWPQTLAPSKKMVSFYQPQ